MLLEREPELNTSLVKIPEFNAGIGQVKVSRYLEESVNGVERRTWSITVSEETPVIKEAKEAPLAIEHEVKPVKVIPEKKKTFKSLVEPASQSVADSSCLMDPKEVVKRKQGKGGAIPIVVVGSPGMYVNESGVYKKKTKIKKHKARRKAPHVGLD